MAKVDVRVGEDLKKTFRRLKKKLDEEGTLRIVFEKRFHEKPSTKRRREMNEKRRGRKRGV